MPNQYLVTTNKSFIIKDVELSDPDSNELPVKISRFVLEGDGIDISDGYHTMHELYEHRMELNIALFNLIHETNTKSDDPDYYKPTVLKAKSHNNGSMFEGYFIAMAIQSQANGGKQLSYHYKLEYWDRFNIPSYDICPYPYDGHTSKDTLERLKLL